MQPQKNTETQERQRCRMCWRPLRSAYYYILEDRDRNTIGYIHPWCSLLWRKN